MKNIFLSFAILLMGCWATTSAQQYSSYVNTMIGTNGMGHTFPGACYPYGAIQLSPDTDTLPHNIAGEYQPRTRPFRPRRFPGDALHRRSET